jgi:translation initiation factor 2 beta subunit (eIF-2beta)/eIF-5
VITALVIGTLLAVGALAFVLYPIFFGQSRAPARAAAPRKTSEQDAAVVALREIEFDRATGKLSDADYTELKTRYTREAIAAMRRNAGATAAGSGRPTDDELEAVVRAYRENQVRCPECGPRPEPDAVFCSNCGRYLRDRCAGCGAPVQARDARYCANCGTSLAA